MKDYQATKNNPYALEDCLYKLMLHIVRNYDYMRKSIQDLPYIPPQEAGAIGDGNSTRPKSERVERLAITSASRGELVKAVDKSVEVIPEELRAPVLDHIKYNKPWFHYQYASAGTLRKYQQCFLHRLAWELGYI